MNGYIALNESQERMKIGIGFLAAILIDGKTSAGCRVPIGWDTGWDFGRDIGRQLCVVILASFMLCSSSGCRTVGPNAAGGGAFGGLAGGLAGAAIGASEGKAPEGALIGALTGATVGTVAGSAIDRAEQRDQLDYQRYQDGQRLAAITTDQVVRMTQSGLSNDVIARQIMNQGIVRRPSIDELIQLKNQGVDDSVIQAIQNAPLAGQSQPVRYAAPPQPVFIETYPAYHRFPPHYYHRRRCHPSSVGFSFGF